MLSFFKPKNSLLAKYIEGYYFLKNDNKDFSMSYYTFPNNFQIVTCALDSELILEEGHLISNYKRNGDFVSTFTYNYFSPIKIEYHGKVNELTIYFKPLGLNYFVLDLSKYCKNENFSDFFPFDDFQIQMQNVLTRQTVDESIDCLENYWLSKFATVDLAKMERIMSCLKVMSIQNASKELGISRQYLYRLFKSNLGKTPIEFKRIQRFRNAIDFPDSDMNLDNMFYDQSHFIKEVLSLTKILPTKLFSDVEYKTANPWLII